MLFSCLLAILTLSGCSLNVDDVKATLNEVLFVNKIISYIEVDLAELKEDPASSSSSSQSEISNPFIEKKEETTVTSLDTFVYLKWGTYGNAEADLDLMALLVDKAGLSNPEYLINFNKLNNKNNSVVHMGDDSKNSETIYLNLNDIPSDVDKIYLICYNYNNDWKSLSKLLYSIDSLSEKYEEKIEMVDAEMSTSNYSSAIKLCVLERRGPIWHFKVGCEEILDLNAYLYNFGIETTEYTSVYLTQKAEDVVEKENSEPTEEGVSEYVEEVDESSNTENNLGNEDSNNSENIEVNDSQNTETVESVSDNSSVENNVVGE